MYQKTPINLCLEFFPGWQDIYRTMQRLVIGGLKSRDSGVLGRLQSRLASVICGPHCGRAFKIPGLEKHIREKGLGC